MWLKFDKKKTPRLKSPVAVVALSTSIPQYKRMYSQARELATLLVKKLEFQPIAAIYSSALPPEVIVRHDSIASLPRCEFLLHRGKRDLVLLAGDSSPMDDQEEFAGVVLDYLKELGVKELYSIGARWADNPLSPDEVPTVNGFASDVEGVESLRKHGVKVITDEPAPFFASLIVPMAAERGMRGFKLSVDHGEPSPHVKGVAVLLAKLSEMLDLKLRLRMPKPGAKPEVEVQKPAKSGIYQ